MNRPSICFDYVWELLFGLGWVDTQSRSVSCIYCLIAFCSDRLMCLLGESSEWYSRRAKAFGFLNVFEVHELQ